MKTGTVGDIRKNFAEVLREIGTGEEITVLRRGKPVAKIAPIIPKEDIEWPDFYSEAIRLEGASASRILLEGREGVSWSRMATSVSPNPEKSPWPVLAGVECVNT